MATSHNQNRVYNRGVLKNGITKHAEISIADTTFYLNIACK